MSEALGPCPKCQKAMSIWKVSYGLKHGFLARCIDPSCLSDGPTVWVDDEWAKSGSPLERKEGREIMNRNQRLFLHATQGLATMGIIGLCLIVVVFVGGALMQCCA